MRSKLVVSLLVIAIVFAFIISYVVIAKDDNKKEDTITCPVTGKEIKKSEAVGPVMHHSKEFYFACNGSMKTFKENPEKFTKCTCMTVDPAQKTEFKASYNGTDYYFCSAGCQAEFEKDPNAYIAKMKKLDTGKVDHDAHDAKDCGACPHSKTGCASAKEKKVDK